jgi:hypothetical protein
MCNRLSMFHVQLSNIQIAFPLHRFVLRLVEVISGLIELLQRKAACFVKFQ